MTANKELSSTKGCLENLGCVAWPILAIAWLADKIGVLISDYKSNRVAKSPVNKK